MFSPFATRPLLSRQLHPLLTFGFLSRDSSVFVLRCRRRRTLSSSAIGLLIAKPKKIEQAAYTRKGRREPTMTWHCAGLWDLFWNSSGITHRKTQAGGILWWSKASLAESPQFYRLLHCRRQHRHQRRRYFGFCRASPYHQSPTYPFARCFLYGLCNYETTLY